MGAKPKDPKKPQISGSAFRPIQEIGHGRLALSSADKIILPNAHIAPVFLEIEGNQHPQLYR
jgi:hypothetical protein